MSIINIPLLHEHFKGFRHLSIYAGDNPKANLLQYFTAANALKKASMVVELVLDAPEGALQISWTLARISPR